MCALAFHPGGRFLAAGGYREVLLWDLAEARLSRRIGAGEVSGSVHALAFLKGGRSLAVGGGVPGRPSTVKIFDLEPGGSVGSGGSDASGKAGDNGKSGGPGKPGDNGKAADLGQSGESGKSMEPGGSGASGTSGTAGRSIATLEGPGEVVYCLTASPDGRLLAAGGADAKVRVWSLPEWKPVATLADHTDWVLGAAFSPDGRTLATAGADKTLNLWDAATWERTASHRHGEALHAVAFGPEGSLAAVAVGGPAERAVRVRRLPDAKSARAAYTGEGLPQGIAWAKRANRMYVAASDGTIKVFTGGDGRGGPVLEGHTDWVYAVALSPDEDRIASGSADGTVRIWSPENGRQRAPRAGRLLATLLQLEPGTDRWVIVTEPGYVATSSPDALRWERGDGSPPPQRLADRMVDSAAVRRILAGETAGPPAAR